MVVLPWLETQGALKELTRISPGLLSCTKEREMKKKKPKLHFEQVSLKEVAKLLEKKTIASAAAFEPPARKTEPYHIPFAVNRKVSR